MRSPAASAASKSACWACGKWAPKTSAVVVPLAASSAHEALRGRPRVGGVGHPRLLRQRALVEPVEQLQAHRADHGDLREVHVGVDEARQRDAVAAVLDRRRRECSRGPSSNAAGGSIVPSVVGDRAVVERLEGVACSERVAWRVGHPGPEDRGHTLARA